LRRLPLAFFLAATPMLAMQPGAAPGDALPGITLLPGKNGASLGVPMQIVLLLTALTMLPAILMSVTPFLRSVVVLHFLRQALGTQTTPSNQVLVGLALFISLLVMQPIANEIYHKSWEPLEAGKISASDAWDLALRRSRHFY
jgi:flagellar biosynthesis protein FliP